MLDGRGLHANNTLCISAQLPALSLPTHHHSQRRLPAACPDAYILTHPGMPCVFWEHFFDWGLKDKIAELVGSRGFSPLLFFSLGPWGFSGCVKWQGR